MIKYYPSPFHVSHDTETANRMCLNFDHETIRLAKLVAEMEPDERSIEEWADDLSKQIAKGSD